MKKKSYHISVWFSWSFDFIPQLLSFSIMKGAPNSNHLATGTLKIGPNHLKLNLFSDPVPQMGPLHVKLSLGVPLKSIDCLWEKREPWWRTPRITQYLSKTRWLSPFLGQNSREITWLGMGEGLACSSRLKKGAIMAAKFSGWELWSIWRAETLLSK